MSTLLLDRLAILSAPDITTEDVAVPEWGGAVRVTTMSGIARDAFSASLAGGKEGEAKPTFVAALVAATVVDCTGRAVFTTADVAALSAKSAVALERVAAVASRLNGLGVGDVEAAQGN